MQKMISVLLTLTILCSCAHNSAPTSTPQKTDALSAAPKASSTVSELSSALTSSEPKEVSVIAEPEKPAETEATDSENNEADEKYQKEIKPMIVHQPPLSEPLPAADENGWQTIPLKTTEFNLYLMEPIESTGIYWLNDTKVIFFEPLSLMCADLETQQLITIMSMDVPLDDIDPYLFEFVDEERSVHKYLTESFVSISDYIRGHLTPSLYKDGVIIHKDKNTFSIATCGSPDGVNWYTFSSDDLSFLGKNYYDFSQTTDPYWEIDHDDFGELVNTGPGLVAYSVVDNININGDLFIKGRKTNDAALQNIINADSPIRKFNFIENHNYQFLGQSPSGEYWAFINHTKSKALDNQTSVYVEIFNKDGKLTSDLIINNYELLRWDSQIEWRDGHAASNGSTCLWDGADRICILGEHRYDKVNKIKYRTEEKYFNVDGTAVDEHIGYYLRTNTAEGYYDLMLQNEDGSEQVIKEKVLPFDKSNSSYGYGYSHLFAVFNPSFTACIWENGIYGTHGITQWQLP